MEVRVKVDGNRITLEKREEKLGLSYSSLRGWQATEKGKILKIITEVGGLVVKTGYREIIFTLDPLDQANRDRIIAVAKNVVNRSGGETKGS